MVRNFGEKRSKKKGKKSKAYKSPRDAKETEEVSSQELAIYVPSEGKPKVEECRPGKHQRSTYRAKRTERQRGKKDRSKDNRSYSNDYPEDEDDEDDDDLDYGGEYDEIIQTGPARREAREAREAEQMVSSTVTFIDVGAMHRRPEQHGHGTSRRGRRGHVRNNGGRRAHGGYGGYSGDLGLVSMAEFSMLDLLVMAIADRLNI